MPILSRPADGHALRSQAPTADVSLDGETEAVLECSGLVRRYGDHVAVDGIGFTIGVGETYGLLGPNGAGKSTCIRMICGLLAPNAGSVRVCGRAVDAGAIEAKALIGFVPQDVALYGDLTARENLQFFGRIYRLSGRLLRERVEAVLRDVDLVERGDDRVDSYSGGMKRRLNIAAGLLHHPRLLVLDEPTVGVDPQSRYAILESVRRLGEGGMAVLYTTHYMEEADRVCDRVGIIDRGRIVAEGTRRELIAQLAERDHIKLTASGDVDGLAEACARLDGIDSATVVSTGVDLVAIEGRRRLTDVVQQAERLDVEISSVQVVEPDLETVFLHLTGTELRE